MGYQPKFSDPRVISRIRRALGFARGCLHETKEQEWSSRYIDQFFGKNSNEFSKWLRNQLLIVTDHRYNKDVGECKKYLLYLVGYNYLKDVISGGSTIAPLQPYLSRMRAAELLEGSTPTTVQVSDVDLVMDAYEELYSNELITGNFVYDDRSNRYWHPLQNLRRYYKRHIFAKYDMRYEYDIVACAPTLIHQYAQQLGMDLYLFALQDYLKDRTLHRKRIAVELGITEDVAKEIINALFAGARISINPLTAIYKLLNGDISKINHLKKDAWFIQLREDIKICWDYIVEARPDLRAIRTNKNGVRSPIPLTSTNKWGLYFWLERQVLSAVREWLDLTYNTYFLEHDGWNTKHQICVGSVVEWVRYRTNYKICINEKKI